MTADFALSLFFEGIRLHRRTPEGWTLVGEVPLDSSDLPGALAALREAGRATGRPWTGTRLLLPPQQVRTLALEGHRSEAEVRTALEGVTPYPVEDLVFDHAEAEGRTYIAAVARETLYEAEAFAAEHGFRPLAFGAVLPDFPREAEFGPARLTAALTAEPPLESVEAASPAEEVIPERPEPPTEAVIIEAEAAPALERTEASAEFALPETPSGEPFAKAPPLDDAPASNPPALGEPEPVLATVSDPVLDRGPDPDLSPDAPPSENGSREPAIPSPVAPAAPGWTLASPVASLPEPRLPSAPAATRQEPAAGASIRIAATGRAPRPTDAETIAATDAGRREKARVRGKPRYLGLVLTVVLLLAMAAVGVLAASSQQGLAGLFSLSLTEVASAPPAAATPSPAITRAEPAATLAPPAPEVTEAATQAVAAAMAALTPAPEATDEAGANEPEVATAVGAPRIEETPGEAVSPEEADRVYAATGVWLRAPRLPLLPQAGEAVSVSAALPTLSPGKELEAPPVLVAIAPDAGPRAQVASAVPGGASGPDEQGLAQVHTDLPGVQVVTGAPSLIPPTRSASPASEADDWLNAMAGPPSRFPPERPDAPEGFAARAETAASEDPASAEAAAPWLNAMAEPPSRFPPARPEPPAEFLATQVAAPAAGPAVLAFADGAAAAPGGVSLAGLRPAPRPDDLSPPEGYEPPPRILASFDGPRPDSRPDDLAPEAPEPPDVSDALAEALTAPEPAPAAPNLQSTLAAIVQGAPDPLAGATRQAVAVARVPDTRPRNFDRVVQRQLDRIARASQQAAAPRSSGGAGGVGTRGLTAQEEAEAAGEAEVASSAAAVPSGPTATSVAAAATSADSIALREINLIGVYGQPNARRALVRLGNGRYLRVGVGDQLDGGQVTAIGDYVLNYTKRGRTHQLVIPGG